MNDTNTRHTPGPWKIADDGRTVESADGSRVSGLVVKRMTVPDANLIAAAPELLEALKDGVDCKHGPDTCECAWRDRARAAITKAEGM